MDSVSENTSVARMQTPAPRPFGPWRRKRRVFLIGIIVIIIIILLLFVVARGKNKEGRFGQRIRDYITNKKQEQAPTDTSPTAAPLTTAPPTETQTVITAGSVPSEYQTLYTLLEGKLDTFNQKVKEDWNGSKHPVVFSAGLITANPNTGDALLQAQTFDTTVKYLDRLKDLGVKGIGVDINFPLLTPGFHQNDSKYNQYLDFYKRLFSEIKKRGLKTAVEVQGIFSQFSTLNIKPYYESLTFDEYKKENLAMIKLLALELQPDYITVANEPDMEAINTGQPVNILEKYIEAVTYYLNGVKDAGLDKNIKYGAGFGTWQKDYKNFSTRTAQIENLDFVNIHIYPVDFGLLDRALEISDIVIQNGKSLASSEAWLSKRKLDDGGGQSMSTFAEISGRNAFSFWQPLDKKFLEAIVNLAHYKKFEYISPFWSNYFFSYMDYDTAKNIPGKQRMKQAVTGGAEGTLSGSITETGLYYKQLISP